MTPRFSDNSYIWKCDQCSASFTSEYYLRRHEKKPHGKISHKCGTCHAVFIDLKDYSYHRFTWHKSQKSQDQNPPAPVQIDNTVHTQVVHPTNPTTSDQPQNQDIDWIMKFMESAGHPISPVGNTKMLEKMKADLVFFQSYPMISAALKTTYDTLNEFEKCEVFPPWAEFMASITKMLEMIQAMPPIHPQQHGTIFRRHLANQSTTRSGPFRHCRLKDQKRIVFHSSSTPRQRLNDVTARRAPDQYALDDKLIYNFPASFLPHLMNIAISTTPTTDKYWE